MRWVAKNAVAAGLADRLEVQVAYAIGRAKPVGLYVETFGTGHVDDAIIEAAIRQVFDLRPAAIIRDLDLLRPIYAQTATYGHFGRELPGFTWEQLDRVDALRAAAGLVAARRLSAPRDHRRARRPRLAAPAARPAVRLPRTGRARGRLVPGVRVKVPLRTGARMSDGYVVEVVDRG